MKSRFSVVLLALLLVSMLSVKFGIRTAKTGTATIVVPDDYPTIQGAINHASYGDTIFVRNGVYCQNVVVNKTLSIMGENENATVIDGQGIGTTVQVAANNVIVSGFTVQNSGAGYSLSGALSGIQVYCSSGNNISHNVVRGNYVGISLRQSSGNVLSANRAYGNSFNFAVDVTGDGFSQFDNCVDTSNTVDGRNIYYLKGESNVNLGATSNAGTIYLINCKNITIKDLILENNYHGVFLWNTTDSCVANVTARWNCDSGIRLEQSSNNTIICNRLTNQEWCGIRLVGSERNLIMSNDASFNWNEGIYSLRSSYNRIVSNVLSHTFRGLLAYDSDGNYVADNLFSNDFEAGVTVYSSGCTLLENVFRENAVGISLAGDKNVIYHNNFIRNRVQVFPVNEYNNTWDNGYSSGGNYWSDYNGTDLYSGPYQNETGSDGIGDTPYIVGTNNRDKYPLTRLCSIATAINASIDIEPAILNLKWKSNWVAVYVEFPSGYDLSDIDISSIMLNGTIRAESAYATIDEHHGDGLPDLTVEFNRTAVSGFILLQGIRFGNVTLVVTGQLCYGRVFGGSCIVEIRMPGDANCDGKADIADIAVVSAGFGSYPNHLRWNAVADQNEDRRVDIQDMAIVAGNYGKNYT